MLSVERMEESFPSKLVAENKMPKKNQMNAHNGMLSTQLDFGILKHLDIIRLILLSIIISDG